jgi:hypothetical protein
VRRLAYLLVVAVLAGAALVVVGAGQVASGQTGPIGYTVGQPLAAGFNDCEFYSIDASNGTLTQISDASANLECADGLTFAPDGTLYAYTNAPIEGIVVDANLVTIDLATGNQTVVGPLPPVRTGSGGMTFDAAGNLWLYGDVFDPANPPCVDDSVEATCLYQVDPATAQTTVVGEARDDTEVTGLTASCAAGVLGVTRPFQNGFTPATSTIETVDTSTAALSPILPLEGVGVFTTGLDFDASEELWVLAGLPSRGLSGFEIDHVDLTTGEITHQQLFNDGDPQDPFAGFLTGLAIAPATPCPVPPPPAPAPEVVLAPTFTG